MVANDPSSLSERGAAPTAVLTSDFPSSINSNVPVPAAPERAPGQVPIAVVGVSCRLPGHCNSPHALWNFIEKGGIAPNEPPSSRFNIDGHYDQSLKPNTMRSPGGMFLEDVDPQVFDAPFFNLSKVDAIAMDPQQRQLLEVVYECLENAGVTLEQISGKQVGCFVGSYAVDFADMANRDPEDRAESITIGIGRAILSNRISHFLDIKGPSMTIDTACSGSLVSVDVGCQYLQARQANGVIVAACNMYLSPDHNMDMGAMRGASSATGKCHTFDAKADGYIKGEAVNAVYLKRLDDAIRDGDPIRAVIRGTATNSDGRTPGIASPSSEAQASAIRTAYANAGIKDFNETGFLECHGTGTLAGDPIEVTGAASVFGLTRLPEQPLIIGSIKSNVGHSEPAAGISGLMKAVMAVEKGIIPGNPTFIDPNPKIDFDKLRVRATRQTMKWPDMALRRASVNSFGYGGSNAHVVVEAAEHFLKKLPTNHVSSYVKSIDNLFDFDDSPVVSAKPNVLVFSANDEVALKAYISSLNAHLTNPNVDIKMKDLAYTLSERRSRHFHRAFLVTKTTSIAEDAVIFGKRNAEEPKIGFIFTGQGAQWSQMGKDLLNTFPAAKEVVKSLDAVLHNLPQPPQWSLLEELIEPRRPEQLRQPEFSQPLVTALQLAMLTVLDSWGIKAQQVVGHSSGEIAAACAAGLLTPEEAIKIAFFRGQAAKDMPSATPVGMLAVGVSAEQVQPYLEAANGLVEIACFNSPSSLTLSGSVEALQKVMESLKADGHFARMLQVDLAYHSKYMLEIGEHYEDLLDKHCSAPPAISGNTSMVSSVTGSRMSQAADSKYWKSNMVSPVRFAQACTEMISGKDGADFLIEIGPSNALSGPVAQIKKSLPGEGSQILYTSAAKRGSDSLLSMYDTAGKIFIAGGQVQLSEVNRDEEKPAVIIDLPNYAWNHTTKYWHESEASKDWRFRQFVHHDLLGSKVLGSTWDSPVWRKVLRLEDVPWLKDHKMGHEIIFPGAGYIAMAIEAIYQVTFAKRVGHDVPPETYRYELKDVKFPRALVLDDNTAQKVMLSLSRVPGSTSSWYEFKVSSMHDEAWIENSHGFVRIQTVFSDSAAREGGLEPLQHPTPGRLWYKAMQDAGYNFGPDFQKHLAVESTVGKRQSRSMVSLEEPASKWKQSHYPMHPACMDGCFQSVAPSLWLGDRSTISQVLVPAVVDSLIIGARPQQPSQGVSLADSYYLGVGRKEDMRNYASNGSVYDPATGSLLFELKGLRYHRLETRGDVYTSHPYTRMAWKADASLISESGLRAAAAQSAEPIHEIVDIVAFKKPTLKLIEINLDSKDTSSLWLAKRGSENSIRAAFGQYYLTSTDPNTLVAAEEEHGGDSNVAVELLDPTKEVFIAPSEDFDFVLVKGADIHGEAAQYLAKNVRTLLGDGGHALFVQASEGVSNDASPTVLADNGLVNIRSLSLSDTGSAAYFVDAHAQEVPAKSSGDINVARLTKDSETVTQVTGKLRDLGWTVIEHFYPFTDLTAGSTVVVLDELDVPVLATADQSQWAAIQHLVRSECNLLWVTEGSQMNVTNPTKAVAHGFFRTIRAENPILRLMTLDVESAQSPATVSCLDMALNKLIQPSSDKDIESEYVERNGTVHVARVLSDEGMNVVKFEDAQGPAPQVGDLHAKQNTVRLICERLGNIDSLHFNEVAPEPLPLSPNNVEVELYASALNFKDVAVSMGIVPENEHLLGLEGAGIVTRVADNVTNRKVGQRVVVFEKGTFANRIQATTERTFPLPDNMTFEEASTLPAVYLTSMYALFYLANLKKGQRVLVHSASGGVGIASIQLCRYMECELFVTVGTDDKRQFLKDNYGIPDDHIFSSRNTTFATQIMEATDGEGIDVILNSLIGDLLDASWRIIADGGTMVEIGKKDIIDRNSLSMEPFGRNASFRALDFSYKEISDALIAEILTKLFGLIEEGHLKPISPIQVFPFDDINSAFRVLRGGKHIGKLVVSSGLEPKVEVPIRPAKRAMKLRSDVSYLIVGGLKGLCGSLAIYLAKRGAKNLAVISRSGHDDERSQGVVKNINALGSHIDLLTGDVANLDDVRRCFSQTAVPIGGIVQGAMVLRDRPFESMTLDEFHGALACKVSGTWNLHNVAEENHLKLDFFTMLSSISGVVGQKGQANYAGGNVFLDALAVYRRGLGLPATSVDLGVIEDVGYIHANDGMQQNLDTSIWTGINEGLLRKILEYSILQQSDKPINAASSSQLITGIPVPQPEDSQLRRDARFGPLFIQDASSAGASSGDKDGSKEIQAFFVLLRSKADAAVVLAAAVNVVNQHFVKLLRLSEPMEPGRPLSIYGLDSLSAVEFRNWLRMVLQAELTTLEIVNAPSLVSLCEKVITKITV